MRRRDEVAMAPPCGMFVSDVPERSSGAEFRRGVPERLTGPRAGGKNGGMGEHMGEEDRAIVESLVSVVWADGEVAQRELEMLEALLEGFGASGEEAAELRSYAEVPRKLADIPITELSFGARRTVLQHAVIMTWVDGAQGDEERAFLGKMCEALRIPSEEAQSLIGSANERAQQLLATLTAEEQ
ncbi:MAG: TerB family tellurite resistance protein [Myxococcales bacterium]|nr:TerB family tellurite resistance protein [Myxococcales bacterium]